MFVFVLVATVQYVPDTKIDRSIEFIVLYYLLYAIVVSIIYVL